MADLWDTDPLGYAEQRMEWAKRLATTQAAIDKAVKIIRDRRTDNGEQNQATKIAAIGVSDDVRLWHSPEGDGYATIRVGDHRENYRIGSNAFEQWLRAEFGRLNERRIGQRLVPQVPGATALRDAVAQLDGLTRFTGEERRPAIRVGGGDRKVIWLDLGRPDWKAVRITAEGGDVVSGADVAFVRPSTMLPLPMPKRGGSIQLLRGVVNVQPAEFVLAVGWLLQALNPVGPYPIIDAHGPSEAGKTATCKTLLRVIDPTSADLRKARKSDDLLIAAKNNWALGFDNLSYLSADWSDTLCMLATGISSGTRKHYTNDEEHVFTVQRPVLFNGIPVDLTERSDLASRTIKLEIVPLKARRTEADLAEEFARVWPKVLGALLDGLVGAISGWQGIEVEKPARLMDFERFAEAGCRAMDFAEWEFVEAYAANRQGSMVLSVEANAVGRAVVAFLKKKPQGFCGQMMGLYNTLETYKGNANWRDWPKSPTKLSTELRRLAKPLAAIGITCDLDVDRRSEGGTQHDVVFVPNEAGADRATNGAGNEWQ